MHAGTDSFDATAVPLRTLIEYAYDVKPDLIVGLSGPVDSARFDIEAKVVPQDGSSPSSQTRSSSRWSIRCSPTAST